MAERRFLTGRDDFSLSRQLIRVIYLDEFFPNIIIGLWKAGTPAAITIDDGFKALSRYYSHIPEPRYNNAVKAEADGTVKIKNMEPILSKVNDGDRILVVGNIFRSGSTIGAVINDLLSSGKRNLDIRDAVQVYRPADGKRTPRYYAMETEDHVVFPYQMDHLSDDEIRKYRQEVRGFLLREGEIAIPSIPLGKVQQGKLFVYDNYIYPMARQLAIRAYFDIKPLLEQGKKLYVLGVWRGGTPIAIAAYDMLCAMIEHSPLGNGNSFIEGYHNVVAAKSYQAIDKSTTEVTIKNMEAVLADLLPIKDNVVVVKFDDVFERGYTDEKLKQELRSHGIPVFGYDLFNKPLGNKTGTRQDRSLYTLNQVWVVFPHETEEWLFDNKGMFKEETRPLLEKHRPELAELFR